jgi:hypothetical protein
MRSLKIFLILFAIALLNLTHFALVLAQEKEAVRISNDHSYVPENGIVPDEQTARKIAEVVLIPIYGKTAIEKQKPFPVVLSNNIWIVSAYLPSDQLGGVFRIEIAKQDGRIIRLTHGK